MVLLWNALVTLRFCWAIREFTLVWIEIIFEILSNLGAGILPDTDLFGRAWKNVNQARIFWWGRGGGKKAERRIPRRDAETLRQAQRSKDQGGRRRRERGGRSPTCARMDKAEPYPTSHVGPRLRSLRFLLVFSALISAALRLCGEEHSDRKST